MESDQTKQKFWLFFTWCFREIFFSRINIQQAACDASAGQLETGSSEVYLIRNMNCLFLRREQSPISHVLPNRIMRLFHNLELLVSVSHGRLINILILSVETGDKQIWGTLNHTVKLVSQHHHHHSCQKEPELRPHLHYFVSYFSPSRRINKNAFNSNAIVLSGRRSFVLTTSKYRESTLGLVSLRTVFLNLFLLRYELFQLTIRVWRCKK